LEDFSVSVTIGKKADLETVLELILITYNRSAFLDDTLRQLKDSPFAQCRLTVMDNCSTDETPTVVARYQDQFPNFHVIRHPRNIGGDYNYLRAIEVTTSCYTWIVCDDDDFDFTHAGDVISAIESCDFDLVYIASRSSVQLGWDGFGATTARQLTQEGARYHRACAFWPSLIFKSSLYDSFCYHKAPFMFPSMKFINKSLVDDFSVYVAEHEIVIRGEACTGEQRPLMMYREWVTNAAHIEDHALRQYVIEQWTDNGFLKTLCFWIAVEKSSRAPGYWQRLLDILFALTPSQKLKFLTLLPVMVIPIPMPLLLRARELAYRMLGHRDVKNLPPIEVVQR